jgi:phosphoribosyl 1,2-cyclic phosphodiesterase
VQSLGRWLPLNGVPGPFQATFLLSPYHWDHLQGLRFFPPFYDPRNRFRFFGPQPESGAQMESAQQGWMIRPYFPVELCAPVAGSG